MVERLKTSESEWTIINVNGENVSWNNKINHCEMLALTFFCVVFKCYNWARLEGTAMFVVTSCAL